MKKGVIIFLFIIFLIIILAIGTLILIIRENLIKNNENYKGELATSKQQQNLSIFVLPAIPIITIISPENKPYSTNIILLNYSVTNEADSIWYNLDNGMNITINSPLQLTTTKGSHTLYLYANNSYGTTIKNISFFVNLSVEPTQPPSGRGSGGGGDRTGKAEPQENITTPQETFPNTTEQEIPKNITKKPGETPKTSREIITKFLIRLIFLALLMLLIIILIARIKRKLKKRKQKKKEKNILKPNFSYI